MTVIVILAVVAAALIAVALVVADRALKALEKGRRRRDASMRLYAAAQAAQAAEQVRQTKENACTQLTAVLPRIRETAEPRKVA
jgi:hypothetical protein